MRVCLVFEEDCWEVVAFAFERDRVAQAPESCGLGTANLISDPGELVQEHSPTFPTGIRNRLQDTFRRISFLHALGFNSSRLIP